MALIVVIWWQFFNMFIRVRMSLEETEGYKYNDQRHQRIHKVWKTKKLQIACEMGIWSLLRTHLSFQLDLTTETVEWMFNEANWSTYKSLSVVYYCLFLYYWYLWIHWQIFRKMYRNTWKIINIVINKNCVRFANDFHSLCIHLFIRFLLSFS